MKILEYDINKNEYVDLLLLNTDSLMFIDIETDGLSHKNKIILIGLVIFSTELKNGVVKQLFNDDYSSEKNILISLFELIDKYKPQAFISFNGNAFDFPFINSRLKANRLPMEIDKRFNIDIMKEIKSNKSIFELESYTLKNIEKKLNIDRADTISGGESVLLYKEYIKSKDTSLESIILKHNYDDIINMIPLLQIYERLNLPNFPQKLNENLYIISAEFYETQIKINLGRPYKHFEAPIFYENLFIQYKRSGIATELKFDTVTLYFKDSLKKLIILDTKSILGIDFNELSDEQKQSYLISIDDEIQWHSLKSSVKEILCKYNL